MRTFKLFKYVARKSMATTSHRPATTDSAKPEGWYSAKPYTSIPGPTGLPFVGNKWRFIPFIGNLHGYDQLELYQLLYKSYGSIVRLGGLTLPDKVIIYTPEDIEYVFKNSDIHPGVASKSVDYDKKDEQLGLYQGYSGITEDPGNDWLRTELNSILMHPGTVLQYASGIDKITNQLVEIMRQMAKLDPKREMPEHFHLLLNAWTLESIVFVSLNKQLGALNLNLPLDSEPAKFLSAVLEMFQLVHTIKIYKTKQWKRFDEIMRFLTFTLLKYVEEAKKKLDEVQEKPLGETAVLEQLIKADKELCMTSTMDLLNAGVTTAAKIIGSALYFLANNPNVQNSLRMELTSLLPKKDSPITKEVLSEASYLKAVIKETTRVAPLSVGNARSTIKDMVVRGYQIPKGTEISTANLVLSLLEENYTRANEFIPERWLRTTTGDLSVKSTNPFVTLPFGIGPRSCMGKHLAMLELEIGIARIIRNFHLEWHYKPAMFRCTPFYGIIDPLKLRIYEIYY